MGFNQYCLFKEQADSFKDLYPNLALKFFEEQYILSKRTVVAEPSQRPVRQVSQPAIPSLRLNLNNQSLNREPMSMRNHHATRSFEYLDKWP